MNNFGSATGYAVPQLKAVESSPIDSKLSAIHGTLLSLEEEIERLVKQLEPVTLSHPKDDAAQNATPAPPECPIENTLRSYDERITLSWQRLSALRANLRL